MASILLLTHSLNCSQEEFNESLKEYVNSKTNLGRWPCLIPELDATTIKQCVIGPNHLAFLTHDGRVCRIPYQIDSEAYSYSSPKHSSEEETPHPPAAKKTPTTTGGATTSGRSSGTAVSSSNAAGSTQPSPSAGDTQSQSEHTFSLSSESLSSLSGQLGRWAHRVVNASSATSTTGTTSVSNPLNMRATTRGRARILRAARGRVGSGWLSGRAIIPASAVPEELISQAQVVLQGKSRQAIIRELQKTSLDVNLAVNNLLSRDDDDPDEPDEEGYMQESYFPGEDLMSIFETGIPNDEQFVVQRDAIFPEDIIYNPSYNRSEENRSTNRTSNQGASSSSSNRDEHAREFSSSCVRDRWWGMLLDRSEKSSSGSSLKSKIKDKAAAAGSSSQKFGEIQWWESNETESSTRKRFVEIVSLHSELIGVTSDGYLQQWFWKDPLPFSQKTTGHNHKRATEMNLTDDEKVTKIAAQNIRVSILTESGKIATWLDDTLAAVGHKLEHPFQTFSELKGLAVTQLQVCDLYSCVQLSNGSIYWWGVFPFEQRRKILDKVKTKAKKSAIAGSNHIKSGTLVCIRSCPLYYPGAIGFATINGEPRVGELLDKAWSITEKCRFKILEKEMDDVKQQTQETKNGETEKMEEDEKDDGDTEKQEKEAVVGKKRKHSAMEGSDKKVSWKEEEWCLQDVIFVEDIRHVPVGEVLKVDGAYAMVHFSSKLLNGGEGKDAALGVDAMLKESVIRRKDELQIVKWTTPPKMPECYQKVPKQLNISGNAKILTMTLDKKGVHALIKSSSGLRYAVYSLASSRPDPGGVIQPEPANFLSQSSPHSVCLYPLGTKANVLLTDPNNCLYPLVKDNLGGMQSPVWANLSSVNCLATGRKRVMHSTKGKSQLAVTLIVMNENHFLQAVLRSDVEGLNQILTTKEPKDAIEDLVSSKCDGNRNVLHLCVNMCQPSSSKSSSSSSKTLDAAAFFGTPDGGDDTKEEPYEPSLWIPLFDSMACLELILNSSVLSDHMYKLLSEKDAFGYTPFMIAVRVRAYPAAMKLYNSAVKVSTNLDTGVQNKDQLMSMIYPPGSDPDMSPLHMLCCNDTCSFTWTGTKHINQDIFECKTCGLVGPLCCCTECAQVCHIGHECKLKRTSPTAYCDCWEKCPCKALVSGDQEKRKELLFKLVEETELSTKPNNNGHHILLFLAQTVSRQASEQEQYSPNRMTDSDSSKQRARLSNAERRGKVSNQTPPLEHEQEPPKFSKISLTYILKNWTALKSMIMFGCKQTGSRRAKALDDNLINSTLLQTDEIGNHLDGQNGTAFLDNFVHKLIVKCNGEFLDVLLQTLLYRLQEDLADEEYSEILTASKRFIRSVIRVYVVLAACTGTNSTKKKSISASLTKCKHVFQSLNVLVAQEMADIASSVFAPVRMGVVFPSAPFTLGSAPDSTQISEELFSTPPLPERFSGTTSSSFSTSQSRVRFAEQPSMEATEETVNDEEEMETEQPVLQSQTSSTVEESHEESTVQESDVDIDLMAESDSDSEESNNGDAPDNANPTTVSETSRRGRVGRVDGYYSTTEASETEGEEDEDGEDEDDDDDDDDDDEMENQNETSEQRNSTTGESNTAPHALQWAVRNTQTNTSASTSTTAAAHVSGSGLVFIDTSLLRRSGASASTDGNASNPMYCTPSALARTCSLLIREISDLLNTSGSGSNVCLPLAKVTVTDAREAVDKYLYATWEWLWRVMEETEAKLRFGASLTAVSDPGHPQHPLYESQSKVKTNRTTSVLGGNPIRAIQEGRRKKRNGGTALTSSAFDSPSARQEYLSYILSLMRSHNDEHADLLPKLEITSLRHVAYVLDSFIYYLRAKQRSIDSLDTKLFSPASTIDEGMSCSGSSSKKNEDSQAKTSPPKSGCEDELTEDDESEVNDVDEASNDADLKLANHRFFKRSDSTLVLGYEPADPFSSPLKEALPLADRPHLLNPLARRDHLFGVQKHTDNSGTLEPPLTMKLNAGLTSSENNKHLNMSANAYLGRWHMCLELFGRVFIDDVGTEPNSILNELGRFDVKEVKFRREMEKLRNAHQKDLYLEGLDRARPLLLQQALRQLNSQFGRRLSGATPLSVHRLKVSFKDEPGEGSGVVRSFYTAISNAFLADEKLPSLETVASSTSRGGLSHQIRARAKERDRDRRRSSGNNLPSGMVPRIVRRNERVTERTAAELENCQLSLDAPVYYYNSDVEESNQTQEDYVESGIPIHKRELGRRIHKKVFAINTENAGKITGMLLELTPTQIIYLLSRDQAFKEKVNEALDLITGQSSSRTTRDEPTSGSSSSSARPLNDASLAYAGDEDDECLDNSPLFFQPGKPGYYSPRPGRNGPDRLDCLRNVGRIAGLCLLQNELCPLSFNRHVIKYLLSRAISWHDLAFYDPTLYESLRQLIEDSKRPDSTEFFSSLDLTFSIQLRAEEGGGGVDLIKGGSQVEVAPDNVLEYVKKYAEYRMITNSIRALQAMRRGLLDVVPAAHLEGLTAEDFRLLLNGAGDISVQQLMSYTFFSDETGGEVQDKLTKFKKWFWAVVENMTAKQKQDLLYFWTSSPAMPASAEGFQPMPSVTVKPANDHQLPTANTCISRLYVPLYSSKAILRSKFLLAIKTKVFGFV